MSRLITSGGGVTFDFNQAAAAPAQDAEVTVPASNKARLVYGTANISGNVTEGSQIQWQVETGVGTGVFEAGETCRVAEATGTFKLGFSFLVEGGRKYKWVHGGLTGDANSVENYNYVDIT